LASSTAFWNESDITKLLKKIANVASIEDSRTEWHSQIARNYADFGPDFISFIQSSLHPDPTKRSSPEDLLKLPFFQSCTPSPVSLSRSSFLSMFQSASYAMYFSSTCDDRSMDYPLLCLPLYQVFYLWRLAGGNLETSFQRQVCCHG
jgi:serine/threonine protein kinase